MGSPSSKRATATSTSASSAATRAAARSSSAASARAVHGAAGPRRRRRAPAGASSGRMTSSRNCSWVVAGTDRPALVARGGQVAQRRRHRLRRGGPRPSVQWSGTARRTRPRPRRSAVTLTSCSARSAGPSRPAMTSAKGTSATSSSQLKLVGQGLGQLVLEAARRRRRACPPRTPDRALRPPTTSVPGVTDRTGCWPSSRTSLHAGRDEERQQHGPTASSHGPQACHAHAPPDSEQRSPRDLTVHRTRPIV